MCAPSDGKCRARILRGFTGGSRKARKGGKRKARRVNPGGVKRATAERKARERPRRFDLSSGFLRERIAAPATFDPRSFRTVELPEGRRGVFGCPRGQWDAREGRCKVGVRLQAMLRPVRNPRRGRSVFAGLRDPRMRQAAFDIYCLERIDVDALNETTPIRHDPEGRLLQIPPEALPEPEPEPEPERRRRRGRPGARTGRPTARPSREAQEIFARSDRGPGFVLTGEQCVDDLERLTPCSSGEAVAPAGRVLYRPRVGGSRPRIYLATEDEEVVTEGQSRGGRSYLRAGSRDRLRAAEAFGNPAVLVLDTRARGAVSRVRDNPGGATMPMLARSATGRFLPRTRRGRRRNPGETALLVNPAGLTLFNPRRRRRSGRRRRNPSGPLALYNVPRRRRRNPGGLGGGAGGAGSVLFGGLAFAGATLAIRRVAMGSPKTTAELDEARVKYEKWKPWSKLLLAGVGWWLSGQAKWRGVGYGMLAAGVSGGATDLLFPVVAPKVNGKTPEGKKAAKKEAKKKAMKGLAALDQILVQRERGMNSLEDDDEDLEQDDEDLEQDDEDLEQDDEDLEQDDEDLEQDDEDEGDEE